MNYPVIVLGSGGHAKVLLEILRKQNIKILAISDPNLASDLEPTDWSEYKMLTNDNEVLNYSPDQVYLVNGLGSIDVGNRRQQIFQEFKDKGYSFLNVIHPSTIIASDVKLGEGVQIMAGAIIQPGSYLGNNVLVNTGTTIDHDCLIEDHVHLAPGVVLSGNVKIGNGAHLGTGAVAINDIFIGANCTIGAGAVVIDDIPPSSRVVGVPARVIGENGTRGAKR